MTAHQPAWKLEQAKAITLLTQKRGTCVGEARASIQVPDAQIKVSRLPCAECVLSMLASNADSILTSRTAFVVQRSWSVGPGCTGGLRSGLAQLLPCTNTVRKAKPAPGWLAHPLCQIFRDVCDAMQKRSSSCFVEPLLAAACALGPVIRRFISLGLNRVWLDAGEAAYRWALLFACSAPSPSWQQPPRILPCQVQASSQGFADLVLQ